MKPKSGFYYSIILIFCLLSSSSYSQEAAMNTINENDLRTHLRFFTNDSLKGRIISEPGLEISGKYISNNLKRLNIKTVAGADNYMQNVSFTSVKPDKKNTFLKIKSNTNEFIVTNDSLLAIFPHPKNLLYEGNVVFAGYGIIDTANNYNDYDKTDVKDKVIMVMSRSMELAKKGNNKGIFTYETEYEKIKTAMEKGAKAILWVLDPANKYVYHDVLMELYDKASQQIYNQGKAVPFFELDFIIITPNTADLILKSSGKSLTTLQNTINSTQKPASFEISNTKIDFQLIRKVEDFKSSNIIGYIEGSDPVLKNEYIIYTAHYDHLGTDADGNIFHGADDNGSGTAGLLEIAEAFANQTEKPKRSIVFAWMTAEEVQGYGTNYYINHPLFPLEKTVACLNLDMIGRIKKSKPIAKHIDVIDKDSLYVINDHSSSELLKINSAACEKIKLVPDYNESWKLGYSDQAFFYKKGIPVLFYHTGFSEDTHSINDDIEKIDFTKMMKVTQVAFLVGLELGNMNKKLAIDKPVNNSRK